MKLLDFSRENSFDRLNRGKLTDRPRSWVGSYTSRCVEIFLSKYPPCRVGGVDRHHNGASCFYVQGGGEWCVTCMSLRHRTGIPADGSNV